MVLLQILVTYMHGIGVIGVTRLVQKMLEIRQLTLTNEVGSRVSAITKGQYQAEALTAKRF